MPERRLHPRIGVDTQVWLGQDGIFTQTNERIRDLSVGGAFIDLKRETYAVGDVINLRFKLSERFVTCTAIVRNTRPGHGIGVEFLDLAPENHEVVDEIIARKLQRREDGGGNGRY